MLKWSRFKQSIDHPTDLEHYKRDAGLPDEERRLEDAQCEMRVVLYYRYECSLFILDTHTNNLNLI